MENKTEIPEIHPPNVLKDSGFGPYPVTEVSHYVLKLSDKTAIAMKLWLPWLLKNDVGFLTENSKKFSETIQLGATEQMTLETKFPAILEYLPYGKDTPITICRDRSRHSWFCSHGYVCARPDMRGSGESDGLYFDEYTKQEQKDCLEIIEWLGTRPWSSGNVGMYGKSWGGFNGLQAAYNSPEHLKTVISMYSTDDRYTDDIHYVEGDCLLACGMLSWGATMRGWNARPPHPRYFPSIDAWKSAYHYRLHNSQYPWCKTWLSHQKKEDPYWNNGSINVDYTKVSCPVLIIGGLADGYRNAAFRMTAKLNDSSRGIIGPWSHVFPDNGKPGPNIDHLGICLQWWDCHLKGTGARTATWPRLQLFLQKSTRPGHHQESFPGSWISVPNWQRMYASFEEWKVGASAAAEEGASIKTLYLTGGSQLLVSEKPHPQENSSYIELSPHAFQGAAAGEWFCWGENSLPDDQQLPNKYSMCWRTEKLTTPMVISGFPKLFLRVALREKHMNKRVVCARLCDEWEDGASTRISLGVKNLQMESPAEENTGEILVQILLSACSYVVAPGHQLCLAISPTCFSKIFPPEENSGVVVVPEKSVLIYQTLTEAQMSENTGFQHPRPLLQLPRNEIMSPIFNHTDFHQEGENDIWVASAVDDFGAYIYPGIRTIWSEVQRDQASVDQDVSRCAVESDREIRAEFLDYNLDVSVKTSSKLNAENQVFVLYDKLQVAVNNDDFFTQTWAQEIPREYV